MHDWLNGKKALTCKLNNKSIQKKIIYIMTLFEYSTYLCCVTILLVLSIVLFFFKTEKLGSDFYKVKYNLATSMLFYAVVFSLYLYYGVRYQSIYIPNCYISPFYYYYAFFFLSLGVRRMLHAPKVKKSKINILTIPLLCLGGIDYVFYLVLNIRGLSYNVHTYQYYTHLPLGVIFAYMLYFICFAGTFWMLAKVVMQENVFRKDIDNYYANSNLINNIRQRYRWLILAGYVIVSAVIIIDLSTSFYEYHISTLNAGTPPLPSHIYQFMAWLVCIVVMMFTIIVFNSQQYYNDVNEAFDMQEIVGGANEDANQQLTKSKQLGTQQHDNEEADNHDVKTEERTIQESSATPKEQVSVQTQKGRSTEAEHNDDFDILAQRLKEWENKKEHPYLAESLTISKVADDLKVSNRLLSEYLNITLKVNFNTYINLLRINYIKKVLAENPNQTISELAYIAGFTDASALTKVFKRLTGTTPSKYRVESRKNANMD